MCRDQHITETAPKNKREYANIVATGEFQFINVPGLEIMLNIYILGVFTEKLYSKPLEHNVVYIPITTSSHMMSVTSE